MIELSQELIDMIDKVRGDTPRHEWLRMAAEEKLVKLPDEEELCGHPGCDQRPRVTVRVCLAHAKKLTTPEVSS